MKIVSLLFMIVGIIMIITYGFLYLFGFAMSFDTPGSANDPKAWLTRLWIFMPMVLMVVILILAFMAFYSGHYKQSALLGSLFPISGLVFYAWLFVTSVSTIKKFKEENAREAEDARLYPIEKYLRPVEGGTDTIIVFPNRIVAYRHYQGTDIPWAGPLGDLNDTRDTIVFKRSTDTKINFEDLPLFMDDKGRKFTDVYHVR